MAEDNKVYVDLFEFYGTGLIIPSPTGVFYSNQSGGVACNHLSCEGFFVPLMTRSASNKLMSCSLNKEMLDYFSGPKWNGHCYGGIDTEDANYLDSLFQKYDATRMLRIDREKLKESEEAWFYVTIDPLDVQKLSFRGVRVEKGILVFENSD